MRHYYGVTGCFDGLDRIVFLLRELGHVGEAGKLFELWDGRALCSLLGHLGLLASESESASPAAAPGLGLTERAPI